MKEKDKNTNLVVRTFTCEFESELTDQEKEDIRFILEKIRFFDSKKWKDLKRTINDYFDLWEPPQS